MDNKDGYVTTHDYCSRRRRRQDVRTYNTSAPLWIPHTPWHRALPPSTVKRAPPLKSPQPHTNIPSLLALVPFAAYHISPLLTSVLIYLRGTVLINTALHSLCYSVTLNAVSVWRNVPREAPWPPWWLLLPVVKGKVCHASKSFNVIIEFLIDALDSGSYHFIVWSVRHQLARVLLTARGSGLRAFCMRNVYNKQHHTLSWMVWLKNLMQKLIACNGEVMNINKILVWYFRETCERDNAPMLTSQLP